MSTERVGIELEVLGYDQAKQRMDYIYNEVVRLGKEAEIELRIDGDKQLNTVAGHVKTLTENLRALQAQLEQLGRKSTSGMGAEELKDYRKELDGVRKEITTTRNTINQLETASKNANKVLAEGAKQAAQAAKQAAQAEKERAQAAKQSAREQTQAAKQTAQAIKQANQEAKQAAKAMVSQSHYPGINGSSYATMSTYNAVKQKMDEISQLTSTWRGKNAVVEFAGSIDTVSNHITRLQQKLVQLNAERENLTNFGGSATEIERLNAEIRVTSNELNQISTASQRAGRSLRETFNSGSSMVGHLGSAFQSLGAALQRIASPFRTLMQGTVFSAGYSLFGKVTSGISAGFARYDVMKKYPLMMAGFNKANYTAADSINELDQSVRGLPTSLDDIMQLAQRFTMTMGDMEQGTKLAIAANNAFLASMSTDTQRYQGMMQLQDVIGGKDLNAREWQALANSMMPAIRMMGEELGYTGEALNEYVASVQRGEVANEDFIAALIKAGTGAGKAAKMAGLSKSTWSAVASNFSIAFARMSANVLQAFDEISETVTGKTLVQYMAQDLIPKIDVLSEKVIGWIKTNKSNILGFFRDIKKLDIKGLLTGYASGLMSMVKAGQGLAKMFGGTGMRKFGWLFGVSGPLGGFLNVVGGLLKGGRFGGGALAVLGRLLRDGFGPFGGLKLGKRAKDAAETATAVESIGTSFKRMGNSLIKVLTFAGSIAILSGAGFVAFKSVKSIMKDLVEIIEIIGTIDPVMATNVVSTMAVFFAGLAGLANVMPLSMGKGMFKGTAVIGGIITMISGFAALDTWLLKLGLKNIKAMMDTLADILNSTKTMPTNASLSNVGRAINALVEIYTELEKGSLKGIYTDKANGYKARIDALGGALKSLKEALKYISEMADIPDINTFKANVGELIEGLGEVYRDIEDSFKLVTKKEAKKADSVLKSVSSMIDSIDHIYDILRVREWSKPMDTRIDNIKTMFTKVVELYDQLNVDFGTKYGVKTSDRISTSLSSLTSVFDSIDHIYALLREREWNADVNRRLFGIQGQGGINNMFKAISRIYTDVLRPFFGSDFIAGTESVNISTSLQNLQSVFTSIDSIYALLRGRQWNVEMGDKIGYIKDMLNEISKVMPSLANLSMWKVTDASGRIDSVTNVVKSIASLATESKTLEGVSLESLITSLSELIPQIKEVGQQITDGFVNGIDFNAMSSAMKKGLDRVLASTNGYAGKFRSKARSLATAFTSTLRSQLSNITVTTSITVKITSAIVTGANIVENVVQDTINGIKEARPDLFHLGGTVYRARGGGIGKARGTDTVHAMLTPGEYVQNRHAVSLFGKQFMDRVNALDINGAMNALHSRFGNQITASRTSTINNTVNHYNNQQYTQNVTTNNPNFARMRNNRYAGAL